MQEHVSSVSDVCEGPQFLKRHHSTSRIFHSELRDPCCAIEPDFLHCGCCVGGGSDLGHSGLECVCNRIQGWLAVRLRLGMRLVSTHAAVAMASSRDGSRGGRIAGAGLNGSSSSSSRLYRRQRWPSRDQCPFLGHSALLAAGAERPSMSSRRLSASTTASMVTNAPLSSCRSGG
jgi:hypothetical protein